MSTTIIVVVMGLAIIVMFGVVVWAARGGLDDVPDARSTAPPRAPARRVDAAAPVEAVRKRPVTRTLDEDEMSTVVFADPAAAEAAFAEAFADGPAAAPAPPAPASPFPSDFGEPPRRPPAAQGLFDPEPPARRRPAARGLDDEEMSTVVYSDLRAAGPTTPRPAPAAQGLFDANPEELATVVFSSSMADELLGEAVPAEEERDPKDPGR